MMVSIETCGVEFIDGATGPSQSAPVKRGASVQCGGDLKRASTRHTVMFCEDRLIKCHIVACVSYQPTLNSLEKYRL